MYTNGVKTKIILHLSENDRVFDMKKCCDGRKDIKVIVCVSEKMLQRQKKY
jgi:hypothetical protein